MSDLCALFSALFLLPGPRAEVVSSVTPRIADLAALLKPPVFTRDTEGASFRKLVFGSDSYITIPIIQTEALDAYKMHLLLNQIKDEDKQAILGGTVASWMGIEL